MGHYDKNIICTVTTRSILSPWWRHQMETFSVLLAFCVGNSPVTGEFPTQRPVTRSFDFFICAWINASVNNCEADDLRRHHAYYDVIVMTILHAVLQWQQQNLNQIWNTQQTPHTSPQRASYGVYFVRILEKINRVIMAPHCIVCR